MAERTIRTGTPYWLVADVALTATAGETVTATSDVSTEDLEVLGGITDLQTSRAIFSIFKKPIFSDDEVPLLTLFGQADTPRPVLYYQRPLPLDHGKPIKAVVLNVGGEGAGKLIYLCRQIREGGALIPSPGQLGDMHVVAVDSKFTASAADETDNSTPKEQFDYVLYGFHTDLATATLRISGITGRPWMKEYIPVWALAGKATSPLSVQYLPEPYYVPAGHTMLFEFKNPDAEASGQLYLIGQKLPAAG